MLDIINSVAYQDTCFIAYKSRRQFTHFSEPIHFILSNSNFVFILSTLAWASHTHFKICDISYIKKAAGEQQKHFFALFVLVWWPAGWDGKQTWKTITGYFVFKIKMFQWHLTAIERCQCAMLPITAFIMFFYSCISKFSVQTGRPQLHNYCLNPNVVKCFLL